MERNAHTALETARPVAIGLIERGLDLPDAAKLAALFTAFMKKNQDVTDARLAAGEAPESITAGAMIAFREYLTNAAAAGALDR